MSIKWNRALVEDMVTTLKQLYEQNDIISEKGEVLQKSLLKDKESLLWNTLQEKIQKSLSEYVEISVKKEVERLIPSLIENVTNWLSEKINTVIENDLQALITSNTQALAQVNGILSILAGEEEKIEQEITVETPTNEEEKQKIEENEIEEQPTKEDDEYEIITVKREVAEDEINEINGEKPEVYEANILWVPDFIPEKKFITEEIKIKKEKKVEEVTKEETAVTKPIIEDETLILEEAILKGDPESILEVEEPLTSNEETGKELNEENSFEELSIDNVDNNNEVVIEEEEHQIPVYDFEDPIKEEDLSTSDNQSDENSIAYNMLKEEVKEKIPEEKLEGEDNEEVKGKEEWEFREDFFNKKEEQEVKIDHEEVDTEDYEDIDINAEIAKINASAEWVEENNGVEYIEEELEDDESTLMDIGNIDINPEDVHLSQEIEIEDTNTTTEFKIKKKATLSADSEVWTDGKTIEVGSIQEVLQPELKIEGIQVTAGDVQAGGNVVGNGLWADEIEFVEEEIKETDEETNQKKDKKNEKVKVINFWNASNLEDTLLNEKEYDDVSFDDINIDNENKEIDILWKLEE